MKLAAALISLLLEDSDYDKYNEFDSFLNQRKDSVDKRVQRNFYEFNIRMFKKYGNDDDMQNLRNYNFGKIPTEDFNKYDKPYFASHEEVFKNLTDDELKEYEKVRRQFFGSNNKSMGMKALQQYFKATAILQKKYPEYDGMRGDLKAKDAYHLTTLGGLEGILDDDLMYSGESGGVSLTTNKGLLKRKPVFYHGSRDYRNIGAKLFFDLQKIRKDLKVKKGSENVGTHYGEEEIFIPGEFENVGKYITKVLLIKNGIGEKDKKQLDRTIAKLKEKGIPYYFDERTKFEPMKYKEYDPNSDSAWD